MALKTDPRSCVPQQMAARRAIAVRLLFPKGFKRTPCFLLAPLAMKGYQGWWRNFSFGAKPPALLNK